MITQELIDYCNKQECSWIMIATGRINKGYIFSVYHNFSDNYLDKRFEKIINIFETKLFSDAANLNSLIKSDNSYNNFIDQSTKYSQSRVLWCNTEQVDPPETIQKGQWKKEAGEPLFDDKGKLK